MGEKARPQCYFDVEINRDPVGRIVFQLFSDVCPKTCMNFLSLCTGEKGIGKVTGKKLWYKGSTFHRVVKHFMIQGGDFSEGNGKGGESIYGGFFKDENFILKHDRAFLLSMANRGKHTNGSQFFITTKPAAHLDGVHVVFGLVISGFEVIEQIENQKSDAASRPYADVRVVDCGLVGSKATKDEKVKQATFASGESDSSSKSSSSSSSSESSSSDSEEEAEKNRRRKRKRKAKVKPSKKRRKETRQDVKEDRVATQCSTLPEKSNTVEDKETGVKRDKPVVRPEEIPPVPENRFLLRRDAPIAKAVPEPKPSPALPDNNSVTKSGRKIKGRGTIRYHTPPRSRSRSESDDDGQSSETPPHWKEEMQRLKTYKPSSGEKWSKGDKLSDRMSSRWDGSLSPRSSSWSHDGYRSDASRGHVSRSKTRKKDKKLKHKKKAKKAKHTKKRKPPKKDQPSSSSHKEESSSKKRKSSQERTRRSTSRSSRESSKKGWSRSDKDQRSSCHSSKNSYANSRSRSRSYSRGSERSRTTSGSTSRSRSRSKSRSRTKSRSRNRNASGAHSSAHSHHSSKQVKSSPSSQKKDAPPSRSKPNTTTEPGKAAVQKTAKSADDSVLAYVSENVISLSDSPPPSRWKPGQKPWKPSYERIQEIKPKTTNALPAPARHSGGDAKDSSFRNHRASSDSERSDYSRRSSSSRRRTKHHSSRSRSYSRSYSRSRSRSSSSSQAGGRASSSYDSSSSSDSNDGTVPTDTCSAKRRGESKDRTVQPNTKGTSITRKSTGSVSNSHSSESEGDEFTKSLLQTTKALLENHNSCSPQQSEDNKSESKPDSQSDKDGTQAVISDIDKVLKSEKLKESVEQVINEEKSSSQNANLEDSAMSSGKEEGEASSESDSEVIGNSKTPPSGTQSPCASESISEKLTKSPLSNSSAQETSKSKSKKHKRRSSKKKSHLRRAKEKSKKKKEKKQKAQKKKQTFRWQPPLEFGEEDEEETAEAESNVRLSNPKDLLLDKSKVESKITPNGSLLIDKVNTEPRKKVLPLTPALKRDEKNRGALPNLTKGQLTAANAPQRSDDIKTFTSHRSLPLIKLETNSSSSTPAARTGGTSDQAPPLSTSVPSVSENVQVKEEKSQSTPAVVNTAGPEKPEAAGAESVAVDNKWKPVQGPTFGQPVKPITTPVITPSEAEKKPQGLRIEIKSKNKVKPGSLFDEVRKTARLNQRPRNQESSSEERSSSQEAKSRSGSKTRSRSKSRSASSHRSRSQSSSRSRSRSHSGSSSSRSRSYSRSRSRERYSRRRSRTRSRSYGSYRSRTYSRSRSRSVSYRRRRRSRSRSHTYDSYSRSRSQSRSPAYHRSRSYDRRSRSRQSSYSGSDHSYRRRHSGRS
ncbi:PREDICTED: NK-tumor recognition protein [Nanorana parkeri]|uniref:NK-tumor recognition protein n=1 Tax=Nanorana parkeri TaxID=125878 RepID=UPI000854D108|nr:PREDICTED: NK-tumor recognition protein [Nanorana parkeri]